jgi:hypothetical protein
MAAGTKQVTRIRARIKPARLEKFWQEYERHSPSFVFNIARGMSDSKNPDIPMFPAVAIHDAMHVVFRPQSLLTFSARTRGMPEILLVEYIGGVA